MGHGPLMDHGRKDKCSELEEHVLRSSGWSTGLPGMLSLACMNCVWARDAKESPAGSVCTLDRYSYKPCFHA